MEQLTKNQAVATSQEAVQNQNEPQLRDENAHNDTSVHGVLTPTYQAGLRRDAVQPDIEAERKKRDEIEAGKSYCFFFHAGDGIRDDLVTGVQTCALPISRSRPFGNIQEARAPASVPTPIPGSGDRRLLARPSGSRRGHRGKQCRESRAA